jgi:hypothetical protein
MDFKKWHFWLLCCITIVLVVVVVYVYVRVSDCCEDGPPGPGPIIVIQPTGGGGTPTASWSVSGAPAIFGTSGQLREDAFGNVEQFTASSGSCAMGTCQLQKLELTIKQKSSGEMHTVTIEKTTSNQMAWSVDSYPLVACDFANASTPPDCAAGSSGLPLEFDGTIQSVTATLAYSGGPPTTLGMITSATMRAKK